MARSHRFSGVSKVIAATTTQTITFPANEIEGAGVVGYDILFQGGADIADVERIRVFASGDLILDMSPAQLRTWIEGTHRTGTVQPTTDTRLHIPLYMPDLVTRDERDGCQFPLGAQPQVEIDLLNTVPAGTAIIGWTKTDVAPMYASRLYSSVLNFSASQVNARYALQDGGVIKGIIINTVGVDRARLVLSDREVFRVPGPQFNGLTFGNDILALRMNESPVTLTDPFFVPVSFGIPAAVGSSYLELDTGAAWAGVSNEIVVWSCIQLQQGQV